EKRTIQAIRKKKPLLFHWRGGYLTRDVLTELMQKIREAAATKDMHAIVHVNWPQAVLRAEFTADIPVEEIITDEADESEDE
ncbi:MAG: peptidase, partial [Firmicutes bacterium]|nr:peptidase [Bacillota bacterium]